MLKFLEHELRLILVQGADFLLPQYLLIECASILLGLAYLDPLYCDKAMRESKCSLGRGFLGGDKEKNLVVYYAVGIKPGFLEKARRTARDPKVDSAIALIFNKWIAVYPYFNLFDFGDQNSVLPESVILETIHSSNIPDSFKDIWTIIRGLSFCGMMKERIRDSVVYSRIALKIVVNPTPLGEAGVIAPSVGTFDEKTEKGAAIAPSVGEAGVIVPTEEVIHNKMICTGKRVMIAPSEGAIENKMICTGENVLKAASVRKTKVDAIKPVKKETSGPILQRKTSNKKPAENVRPEDILILTNNKLDRVSNSDLRMKIEELSISGKIISLNTVRKYLVSKGYKQSFTKINGKQARIYKNVKFL